MSVQNEYHIEMFEE